MSTRRSELVPVAFLVACTAIVFGLAAIVVVVVGGESLAVVFDSERHVTVNVLTLARGTLRVSSIAVLVALPTGFAVAVSVRELLTPTVRVSVRSFISLFATMPPIVFAYVAIAIERGVHTENAAALTLGVMLAPAVARLFDTALRSAPERMRDAAMALGATRLEAWTRVVMPIAAKGLASAALLAFLRALGESVIVALAAPETTRTFAGEALRAGMGRAPGVGPHEIFIIGAVLLVVTLVLHRIALVLYPRERT
jgi:phosphate transport system permease protein